MATPVTEKVLVLVVVAAVELATPPLFHTAVVDAVQEEGRVSGVDTLMIVIGITSVGGKVVEDALRITNAGAEMTGVVIRITTAGAEMTGVVIRTTTAGAEMTGVVIRITTAGPEMTGVVIRTTTAGAEMTGVVIRTTTAGAEMMEVAIRISIARGEMEQHAVRSMTARKEVPQVEVPEAASGKTQGKNMRTIVTRTTIAIQPNLPRGCPRKMRMGLQYHEARDTSRPRMKISSRRLAGSIQRSFTRSACMCALFII